MNRMKIVTTILCLSIMMLFLPLRAKADDWNKETVVTFSQPFEIPGGIVLPAGTYVFKLMDSSTNRNIVQIFNKDKSHLYATILAVNNYRLNTTDKTVMTFSERAADSPEAIRAWFYPGMNYGQEFVYPKKRAYELAKITKQPILAMPDQMESVISKPAKTMNDESVIALRGAPLTAVTPAGEDVEVAQVVATPPAQATTDQVAQSTPEPSASTMPEQRKAKSGVWNRSDGLPKTASNVPMFGLLGLLAIGASLSLSMLTKQID